MAQIFAFCNQKGGVGKTTTAVNLSAVAATLKVKTLLIDLDPQGNATSGVGVDKNTLENSVYDLLTGEIDPSKTIVTTSIPMLYVIPSRPDLTGAELELIDLDNREYRLKNALESVKDDFDLIIIDCPPTLNLLTINGLCSANKLLIPLQCEYYALEGLGQLVQTFELIKSKLNPDVEIGGVALTMVDKRTKLAEQVIDEVKEFFGKKVFETCIPRSVRVSEAPSHGQPLIQYDPSGKGSKAYVSLTEEFLKRFDLIKDVEEKIEETKQETPSEEVVEQAEETTATAKDEEQPIT